MRTIIIEECRLCPFASYEGIYGNFTCKLLLRMESKHKIINGIKTIPPEECPLLNTPVIVEYIPRKTQ